VNSITCFCCFVLFSFYLKTPNWFLLVFRVFVCLCFVCCFFMLIFLLPFVVVCVSNLSDSVLFILFFSLKNQHHLTKPQSQCLNRQKQKINSRCSPTVIAAMTSISIVVVQFLISFRNFPTCWKTNEWLVLHAFVLWKQQCPRYHGLNKNDSPYPAQSFRNFTIVSNQLWFVIFFTWLYHIFTMSPLLLRNLVQNHCFHDTFSVFVCF